MSALLVSSGLAACGAPQGSGEGGDGGGQEESFKTKLQMGTGSVGGVYFPLGQELANLWTDNINVDGFGVSAVEASGSAPNLVDLESGDLQLALVQNTTAVQAIEGSGEFEGSAMENVGFMGQLYPEAVQIITLESTGIESIEDLEGKTIAIGPPGNATQVAAKAAFEAYGIEDYTAVEERFSDAKTKLQDGNIDASIEVLGVPAASISELQAATGEVKLLPLEGEKQRQQFTEEIGFEEYEIPAGTYDFLEEPITTASAFAGLWGSTTQVSPDLGYKLTKTTYEQADQFTLPQKEFITLEDALAGRDDDIPLHPGAERYFKEEGVLE